MNIASKTAVIRPDFLMAFRSYPVPVLAAALIAGWYLDDLRVIPFWLGLLFDSKHAPPMLVFGFFAATAAGFATARSPSWISCLAQASAFLAGIGAGFWMEVERETVLPLLISLICAVSLAAGLAARYGVAGYWLANARLGANLAACVIAAGIITLGGAIALYSVEALLDIKVRKLDDALAIGLWAFILPVSWLALARFDQALPDEPQSNILLRLLALVTDGVLIPLVLLLGTIIHLYAARIAVMGELPKGQIGWIVPVYLVVGYGIFLLAQNTEVQLVRLRQPFRRFFLASTVVPLILLGLAVSVRIEAYGVTEDRYFLALLVVGGALLVGSLVVKQPFDIRFVPITAGVLAVVASFGPLSARSTTIQSQIARAYAVLASVPPERWASAKDGGLTDQQKESLISALQHLQRRTPFYLGSLASVWPSHLPKNAWELKDELTTKTTSFSIVRGGVFRFGAITFVDDFYIDWKSGSRRVSDGKLDATLIADGHWLEVLSEGEKTRFDLSSLLTMTKPDLLEHNLASSEGRKGHLVISQFNRVSGPNGTQLKDLSGFIVLYGESR